MSLSPYRRITTAFRFGVGCFPVENDKHLVTTRSTCLTAHRSVTSGTLQHRQLAFVTLRAQLRPVPLTLNADGR